MIEGGDIGVWHRLWSGISSIPNHLTGIVYWKEGPSCITLELWGHLEVALFIIKYAIKTFEYLPNLPLLLFCTATVVTPQDREKHWLHFVLLNAVVLDVHFLYIFPNSKLFYYYSFSTIADLNGQVLSLKILLNQVALMFEMGVGETFEYLTNFQLFFPFTLLSTFVMAYILVKRATTSLPVMEYLHRAAAP
ncbi:hypothetical protein ACJX0J_036658, partial [Zea mays]